MKIAFSLMILCGLFIDAGAQSADWKAPATADKTVNPVANNPKTVAAGKKVFDSLCWSCHGYDGKGTGPAATALPIKPANFSSPMVQKQTDGAIFWKITTGRGTMASYGQSLTPTQRWQLVHFLRTFKAK